MTEKENQIGEYAGIISAINGNPIGVIALAFLVMGISVVTAGTILADPWIVAGAAAAVFLSLIVFLYVLIKHAEVFGADAYSRHFPKVLAEHVFGSLKPYWENMVPAERREQLDTLRAEAEAAAKQSPIEFSPREIEFLSRFVRGIVALGSRL